MHEPSFEFLKTLLQTPSPPGNERQIQDVVRSWSKPLTRDVRTDRHGNVLAVLNPEGSPRIMLAGHCDQISLMVQPIDDKVGVWTVFEALRLLHDRPLQAAVYCVSTVQEEIGLRGATTSAYGINPTIGIAVDVCHATDTPGNDKKLLGDTRLGNGPVIFRGPNINPRVFERLEEAAQRH